MGNSQIQSCGIRKYKAPGNSTTLLYFYMYTEQNSKVLSLYKLHLYLSSAMNLLKQEMLGSSTHQ